ncbi:hypothetical protein ACP70R_013996 [Stipagrostis hirtigluma subsp. patula]
MLPPRSVPCAVPPPAGVAVQPCAGRCPEPWPGRGKAGVVLHRPSAASPAIGSAASLLSPPCSSTLPLLRGAVRAQGAPPVCAPLRSPKPNAKKACDAISELAASLLPDNAWVELLPFLFRAASSPEAPNLQESALLIFARLAPTVHVLQPQLRQRQHPDYIAAVQLVAPPSPPPTGPPLSCSPAPFTAAQRVAPCRRRLAAVQVIRCTPVLRCTTAVRRNGAAIRTLGHY